MNDVKYTLHSYDSKIVIGTINVSANVKTPAKGDKILHDGKLYSVKGNIYSDNQAGLVVDEIQDGEYSVM